MSYKIKRKTKTNRINLVVNDEFMEKLMRCMGEYKSLTQVIEEAINGKYYVEFGTNEVINTKKSNVEISKQIQEEKNVNEQEELEKLKALRKSKKEGVSYEL